MSLCFFLFNHPRASPNLLVLMKRALGTYKAAHVTYHVYLGICIKGLSVARFIDAASRARPNRALFHQRYMGPGLVKFTTDYLCQFAFGTLLKILTYIPLSGSK